MKKIKTLSLSLVFASLALSTVTFSTLHKTKYLREGVLDETHYREEIYDTGVKPVKMRIMDYSDYTQSPTGDSLYNTQKDYHLNALNLGNTWNSYRGDGITIAVIDTGINYGHEDFVYYNSTGTSISNLSACFEDPNGTGTATKKTVANYGWTVMTDDNGHGTNVASTIASRINGKGCVGVAPNVNLMFCKCPNLMSSEVSAAIRYAVDNGADIITMSLGMYATSFTSPYTGNPVTYSASAASLFSSAVSYAHNKGAIILASAGNDNTDYESYPASNNYVIGVGALSSQSRTSKANYSNFNKSTNTSSSNNNVDVTVCGSVYVATKSSSSSYGSTQGTSFSCPITAAALALYCQSHPGWNEASAKQALFDSCQDIGTAGWDTTYGYGCVDISALVGISYDLQGINISKSTASLYDNGDSCKLSATVNPTYATEKGITWSTSDATIASISTTSTTSGEEITVTAHKAGTATITARSSYDSTKYATCTVTVDAYVSSEFSVDSSYSMVIGDDKQISVTWTNGTPTYTDLSYSSSDTSVCTVSSSGLIHALKDGSSNITVESIDDSNVIAVTVTAEPPGDYVLVTDASTLSAGDKVLFVSESASKANGSYNTDNYLNAIDVTISNHRISSLPSDASSLTLGGSSGAWTFTMNGSKLLYGASTKLYNSTVSGAYSTYTISISGTNSSATIKANGSYQIYYNSGAPRFKTYSSAQASFQLYKKDTGTTPSPTNYSVSFNANGGTGTMSSATTTGSTYTVPSCSFTKTGYTFSKWALGSTSGTQYSVGDTISDISNDITLYAIWTENGSSEYTGTYYDDVNTSSASALMSSLHTIISNGYDQVGYDGLWSAYATTDVKPNTNIIWDMYSNEEFECGGSKQGHNYSGEGDGYNREHTIPQSWFNESEPMKSDLFHVYPTDGYVNNRRSNYVHANVSSATYTSKNGSKLGSSGSTGITGTVFEPIDEYKGDFARSYFYFATRYYDQISSFTNDGKVVFSTSFPYMTTPFINVYYAWHLQDPVSTKEINRNNAVYALQKNRNPFIDHPEWVNTIFNNAEPEKELKSLSYSGSPTTTTYDAGQNFSAAGLTITATFTDNSTSNVTSSVTWSPSPLTAGTTSVTGSYTSGGVTKTITISGLTVNETQSSSETYTLEFKNSSSDGSATISKTDLIGTTYIETNTLVDSFSDSTKVYPGKTGVKLGSSNAEGSFTAALVTDAKTSITSIDVDILKYGNDASTVNFTLGDETGSFTPTDTLSTFSKTFDTAISAETLKIETSQKRAYVKKVVIHTGAATPQVSSISLNKTSADLDLNGAASIALTPTVSAETGADTTVSWTSSDTTVATVSKASGTATEAITVTALKVGNATITATCGGKTATCTVTVTDSTPRVTAISISASKTTIDKYQNETSTITPTVTVVGNPSDQISWTSSNTSIATVSTAIGSRTSAITVTPVSTGQTTITASCGGKTAEVTITVTDSTPIAVTGVSLNKSSTSIVEGSSETLTATVAPSDAANKNVSWSSSITSVATVSNGVVTAISEGTTVITVTTEDGGFTASCTVTVTAAPVITYQLEADVASVPFMSGTNHQATVGVKLYQYSNGVKGSVVTSGNTTVDTSSLGNKEVSLTYSSVTYKATVKVTNNGTTYSEGTETPGSSTLSLNTTYKFTSSTSVVSGWGIDTGGTSNLEASGSGNGGYNKFGSGKSSFSRLVFNYTLDSTTKVTSVSIKCCRSGTELSSNLVAYTLDANSNKVYLEISSVKNSSNQTQALNAAIPTGTSVSSMYTYTFTPKSGTTPTGTVYIGVEGSSGGKQFYVNSLSCNYKTITSADNDFTLEQQAKAWANYFISETRTSGTCLAGTDSAKLAGLKAKWADLAYEYENMVSGSKDVFCNSSDSTIVAARQHYLYIVSKFGASELGTDGAFVTDGSSNTLSAKPTGLSILVNADSSMILIAVISLISITSVGLYFFLKKKKEQ